MVPHPLGKQSVRECAPRSEASVPTALRLRLLLRAAPGRDAGSQGVRATFVGDGRHDES